MQIGAGILKTWAFECSGLTWFCKWKTMLLILSPSGATDIRPINLFNIEFTDVFRTKHCWSISKITQIGSDVLKIYRQWNIVAYFWPTLYIGFTGQIRIHRPTLVVNAPGKDRLIWLTCLGVTPEKWNFSKMGPRPFWIRPTKYSIGYLNIEQYWEWLFWCAWKISPDVHIVIFSQTDKQTRHGYGYGGTENRRLKLADLSMSS